MTRSRWWTRLERLHIVQDPRIAPVGSPAWRRKMVIGLGAGLVTFVVMTYVLT